MQRAIPTKDGKIKKRGRSPIANMVISERISAEYKIFEIIYYHLCLVLENLLLGLFETFEIINVKNSHRYIIVAYYENAVSSIQ